VKRKWNLALAPDIIKECSEAVADVAFPDRKHIVSG
jgi:hypothetical protein